VSAAGESVADTNWVQVGASLAGGGFAGAVLTNLVTALRNRRQPIGYRVDVVPVFKGTLVDSNLTARLEVRDPTGPVELDNLFLTEIQLVNRGNRDWSQLKAGITLNGGDSVVHIVPFSPDRHHACTIAVQPCPKSPSSAVDFTLAPFNRDDSYKLRAYINLQKGVDAPTEITFGSPEPVVFRRMPTLAELAAETTGGLAVQIGPVKISLVA
jgi:hypothetical protein